MPKRGTYPPKYKLSLFSVVIYSEIKIILILKLDHRSMDITDVVLLNLNLTLFNLSAQNDIKIQCILIC